MTDAEFAAMLHALAQIVEAGEFVEPPDYLVRSLALSVRYSLHYHAAAGEGTTAWCTECKKLTGRLHECD